MYNRVCVQYVERGFWKSLVKHGDHFLRKERDIFFGSFLNKKSSPGAHRVPGGKSLPVLAH